MDSVPVSVESLLAHREWVRSVARAVVRDPSAADDLEQETWLAALSTPPKHGGALRGWLGAVVRSRARRAGRGDARREARETAAARPGATQSAADLAEIADTHRRVVQAVVELPEPYRQTILLRYFEGLAVDAVAARTGVPLDTARSRIARGLARLRERLAQELGTTERPWHAALVPLIAAPRAPGAAGAAAGTGGAIVATKATWAAVGVVVVAGTAGVFAWQSGGETKTPPAPQTASAPAPVADPPAKPKPPVAVPHVRAAEPDEKPAPAQPAPDVPRAKEETAAERLGRVKVSVAWEQLTLYQALAELKESTGVQIVVAAEAAERFAARPEEGRTTLEVDNVSGKDALELVTAIKGLAYVIEEPRVVIVPMGVTRDPSKPVVDPSTFPPPPKLTVVGHVVDANGAAVPGATIVRYPGSDAPVATADVAGRFELLLSKPYGSLEAHAPGQVPSLTVSVTGQPGAQVSLELATRGGAGSVTVRVVADGADAPLKSAVVTVGRRDDVPSKLADGRAALDRARTGRPDEKGVRAFEGIAPGRVTVTARLRGYARAAAETDVVAGKAAEVTLRLVSQPPLAERLKTERISMKFSAVRVSDAAWYISESKNVNVALDPSLFAGREFDPAVSLEVTDVPVAQALDALCRAIGSAEYVIDEKSDVVLLRAAKK